MASNLTAEMRIGPCTVAFSQVYLMDISELMPFVLHFWPPDTLKVYVVYDFIFIPIN